MARWTTPFWRGFVGLTVNPSRGLLVYTPALLLIPLGLRAVSESTEADHTKRLVYTWSAAALAVVCVPSFWHVWWGGWSYGPRFLLETLPILCLLFAYAVQRSRASLVRGLAVGLVAVSISINALGVFGDDEGAWNARHPEGPGAAFHDTQIGAAARHLLGWDGSAE